MKPVTYRLLLLIALLFFTGCATYVTPGPRADLAQFTAPNIQKDFAREPSNPFPASVIAVRLQGRNYSNHSLNRRGGVHSRGEYSVVLTREVEEDSDLERIQALPQINDIISLNPLLLPSRVDSIDDLRAAVARLRADLILIYTFDTSFFDENRARSLSVITLGFAPTRKVTATTTVAGLIVDTRTGFIYGAIEATEMNDRLSTSWGSRDAADKARQLNESVAFKKLVDEFEKVWPRILAQAEVGESQAAVSSD